MKSARRKSRELALQGLYQWQLSQNEPGVIDANLRSTPGFDKADLALYKQLFYGVIEQVGGLSIGLQPLLDRPVEDLSPIEKAILWLGTYELRNMLDIPYRVVINEAVELAKTFGGLDGYKYVNGVLDKFALEVRQAEIEHAKNR
ncbi:transcription antitermination factor NusB [Ampullimonas aquatilis]|uniref:transcription antitermination factor NusB n=1 Tax=Ampullimonas aquatilis TaxID=1341549 RepID=UPI003C730C40